MQIRVDSISDQGLIMDFEESFRAFSVLAEMEDAGECKFLSPVRIRLEAVRVRDLIEVEGQVTVTVRLPCSRCLKDYDAFLVNRFALTYQQEPVEQAERFHKGEIEIGEDDIGLIHFRGEYVDLREGIQEQVVLAFPVCPLCSVECKGLCSVCGADLNQGDCGCDRSGKSSPFDVLKNFKIEKH